MVLSWIFYCGEYDFEESFQSSLMRIYFYVEINMRRAFVGWGIRNSKKLETRNNYSESKQKFNTIYEYYFYLDVPMNLTTIEIQGIGKPGINISNISATDIIQITRFTIYKNKPVTAHLYVWDENE